MKGEKAKVKPGKFKTRRLCKFRVSLQRISPIIEYVRMKNRATFNWPGTKGCSPGRGFLSTDTRDWLCARGRMPFSRHVRDVCLKETQEGDEKLG